ncbi:MAG: hypothetical protein ABIO80_07810 [Sphingomicrobium sp.]
MNSESMISSYPPGRFTTAYDCGEQRVDHWRRGFACAKGAAMTARNPLAGGCFLTVFILAGFVLGLGLANPMQGVLIGTGVGIALAVAVWLIDRRKR